MLQIWSIRFIFAPSNRFIINQFIMEIRQLKYFVSIAENGSFSEASRRFYLSQSAISQQIKALEDEFKTTLFIRTPHKVKLTESGEMLLPLARQVLHSVNDCQDRMADVNKLLCGELTIGLTPSLESYVRRSMIRFMKIYPNVHLNIYYEAIPQLMHMLRSGQLDVAISIMVEGNDDWVDSTPVMEYVLCAFMKDTHPLADRDELTFKDLEKQSLVMPERALRSHNAVEDYLSKEGHSLQVRAVVNDPGSIINILKHTNCISILSEESVRGNDELRAVPIRELRKPVMAYAHVVKGAHRKRSMEEFLRILKEVIN